MADMVRAAVMTAPRTFEMREFGRPVIGPDEGLLRIEACGICGSDVEQYKGHLGQRGLPMVPGHEPLGIIEEVGNGPRGAGVSARATGWRWRSSFPAAAAICA
jgi:D-arabinose 1-dehydrogenase-like Zn-dependent alcohol dehydrogenase